MEIISQISDKIEDKLRSAECYIKAAISYKDERPMLAAVMSRISTEEMEHVNLLHDQVKLIIDEYRKEHGDPPEKMLGIYEYLHKKHINKATEIKVLQALFK